MKLLPREDKFFEYFQKQLDFMCQAANLLVDGAAAGNARLASAAHQIKAIEEQADTVIHEIYAHLNSTFITPLDPEDIHSLASHLDDVIDGIEDSVHRMLAYRIDRIPTTVIELCRLVQSSCAALGLAFEALAKGKSFMSHCIEVNRLEEAFQANEELQRFAYALAHDLNTPLRGISALTELLIQRNAEKLDESSTECAGLIVNKVKRMQALITGLLDYAAATEKPEGRNSPDQKTLIDCNYVLEQAKLDLDSVIRLSGAQITVSTLPSVPATESQLVQVFSNLGSNLDLYGLRKDDPEQSSKAHPHA